MSPAYASRSRFSYGGTEAALGNVSVWKFDADIGQVQHTCYVKRPTRSASMKAFFNQHPGSKILGTGMPLSGESARGEIGRELSDSEVFVIVEPSRYTKSLNGGESSVSVMMSRP